MQGTSSLSPHEMLYNYYNSVPTLNRRTKTYSEKLFNDFCHCVDHFKSSKDEVSLLYINNLLSLQLSGSLPEKITAFLSDKLLKGTEIYLQDYIDLIGGMIETNSRLIIFLSEKIKAIETPVELPPLPIEIKDMIFSFLPLSHINLPLLTCREWNVITENHLNHLFPIRKVLNEGTCSEKDKVENYAKTLAEESKVKGAITLLQKYHLLPSKNESDFSTQALNWAFKNKSFSVALYILSRDDNDNFTSCSSFHLEKIRYKFPELLELFLLNPKKNLEVIDNLFSSLIKSHWKYKNESNKIQEFLNLLFNSPNIDNKTLLELFYLSLKFNYSIDNSAIESAFKFFEIYFENSNPFKQLNYLISKDCDFDLLFNKMQCLPQNLFKEIAYVYAKITGIIGSKYNTHVFKLNTTQSKEEKLTNLINCLKIISFIKEPDKETNNFRKTVIDQICDFIGDEKLDIASLKKEWVDWIFDSLKDKEDWPKAKRIAEVFKEYENKVRAGETLSINMAMLDMQEIAKKDLYDAFDEDYFAYSSADEENESEPAVSSDEDVSDSD